MCLAIPSKIVEIDSVQNRAIVETFGARREAYLDLLPEPAKIGDYVLVHIGYAMNKIDVEDALESIKIYEEILERMDEEERVLKDSLNSHIA